MKRKKNGKWKLNDDEMNTIAIYARIAKDYYTKLDGGVLVDQADKFARKIYKILDQAKFYEDCK